MSSMSLALHSIILGINVSSAKAKKDSRSNNGATKIAHRIGTRIEPWTMPRRISKKVLFMLFMQLMPK
jgi:hypothetical protein